MEHELKEKAAQIIKDRYLIDTWEEMIDAIEDLLKEKRKLLEKEEPYATVSINELRKAESTVHDLYWDIYS